MKNALFTSGAYRFSRFGRISVCFAFFSLVFCCAAFAAASTPWDQVAAPVITSIEPKEGDGTVLVVTFELVTGNTGADKAVVEMMDSSGKVIATKNVGKSKKDTKTANFNPSGSGDYQFRVIASRNSEKTDLISETVFCHYDYPLKAPEITVKNQGNVSFAITWNPVHEADSYTVICRLDEDVVHTETVPADGELAAFASGLTADKKYTVSVSANRGSESTFCEDYGKTARKDKDREWTFTWFGQSTHEQRNTMQMLDADAMVFKLNSCTYNEKTGDIIDKGGKFTALHDGISFYYTVIDSAAENFELSATFTVDYINNPPDGQEGFGLLAMDSLGEYGVSSVNHYTNSAGVISTKFEENIGGTKKTGKDTLGARFVTGFTPELLAAGDQAIAEGAKTVAHAYSYDQSDLTRAGDVYRITLKKSNTGYHAIYNKLSIGEDEVTEYILYGVDKLLQLDKDHIYVGFAVARGCNATVSDVSFTVTDPRTDPPAEEEPAELVPMQQNIDSPSAWYNTSYPFVFNANCDGKISIKDTRTRKFVTEDQPVHAGIDFERTLTLRKGINDYSVIFKPDENYVPGENQAMAWYNSNTKQYVQGVRDITLTLSIACNWYDLPELYVSPAGSPFGKGTKESPLELGYALMYAKPGQTVVLEGGTYRMSKALVIERGNSGTASDRKTLKSADGELAVLNFANAGGGFQLWGDYWNVKNIEICNTDGNVKGVQVAGDYNILEQVVAHHCGDTGIQISGTSNETFEKWPHDNLILNCTSYANCDPAENNADGFAAKLTCGNNNVFRGCMAYSNIDDGWDMFSKAESGKIGVVLVEDCIAFRNGSLPDGSGNGDGNGFKLGGDGIGIAHVIRNCISFDNGTTGITSNSNPDVVLENCTSFGNGLRNIALYGKGSGERHFVTKGIISVDGADSDQVSEVPSLDADSYFWKGSVAENTAGDRMNKSVFVSADTKKITPGRNADGSIDMKGLLELKADAPANSGARF
ncbi:MAG: right-handed parallel beta-helix repeat-containing protein [Treponemataceae bacterium]|nr:right-handed parallel beta-helix repeat-containing protein [Treponemataceae bacterium]